MVLRQCRSSVENISALAGWEVKIGQARSNHGPEKIHTMEMSLRPFRFSVDNFSALASLEVKLGQTWFQHSPDMVQKKYTP